MVKSVLYKGKIYFRCSSYKYYGKYWVFICWKNVWWNNKKSFSSKLFFLLTVYLYCTCQVGEFKYTLGTTTSINLIVVTYLSKEISKYIILQYLAIIWP